MNQKPTDAQTEQQNESEHAKDPASANRHQATKITMGLLGAMVLLSLLLRFSFSWETLKYAVLGALLLLISVIDYHTYLIPDELLALGLVLYVPIQLMQGTSFGALIMQMLLHGCSVALPLLLFVLVADKIIGKETMGGGDIKLFFLAGVYLGPALTWLALFVSCVAGLIWSVVQMGASAGKLFPFGPSIAIGVWVSVLCGPQLLQWYWQWLF